MLLKYLLFIFLMQFFKLSLLISNLLVNLPCCIWCCYFTWWFLYVVVLIVVFVLKLRFLSLLLLINVTFSTNQMLNRRLSFAVAVLLMAIVYTGLPLALSCFLHLSSLFFLSGLCWPNICIIEKLDRVLGILIIARMPVTWTIWIKVFQEIL